ncbi:MAG TPA: choice-of-anchor Q domain-containing protein, partial [Pyrinomonadaceae bacterium]
MTGKVEAQQNGFVAPDVNNPIVVIALQPDGKILIGGGFTQINGQPRNSLARLNGTGTLDTTFQNINMSGGVSAIAVQPDGKILAGGDFRVFGAQERNNLAQFNADGSLNPGFNPIVNNVVWAIVPQIDGKILIAGTFTTVNGQTRNRIARLNPDGSLDSTFQDPITENTVPGASPAVSAIAVQPDGKILISGYFNMVGGQTRSGIARLNTDGSLDTSFQDANVAGNSAPLVAVQPDGKILIGGGFTSVGGQTRTALARLNSDGSLDTSFQNPNINNGTSGGSSSIVEFALQPDGRILVAGGFISVGGQTREKAARLNADGTLDPSFIDPRIFGGFMQELALQADGKILVSGSFISVGGRPRFKITRLNPDGSLDVPLPMVFTVTKTADTADGACDADCSLREAINAANASESDDTIEFDANLFGASQVITLINGQLPVCNSGNLIINGTQANRLTISGNNQSRVFRVFSGVTATINNLTIANGKSPSDGSSFNGCFTNGGDSSYGGGGIENRGTLFINNSIIRDNITASGSSGGGLSNAHGTITITNSVIRNNTSISGSGGIVNIGIYNINVGNLTLVNSTVSDNSAPFDLGNGGGGIGNYQNATLTLTNSTVNNNTTGSSGGGIRDINSTIFIKNSTISKNTAANSGGGIRTNGVLNLSNATVAFNQAASGGGIVFDFNVSPATSVTRARNTIISNNSAGSFPDFSGGLLSQGYNLIGNTNGTTIGGETMGNLLNVNPLLDPDLRSSVGSTAFHALLSNSPAIDKGAATVGVTTDQRGRFRPFDFPSIPNAAGGDGSDIGAFERQNVETTRGAQFDFDGDGKADLSVFRPSSGYWYISNSSNNSLSAVQFGAAGDLIAPADFDGDGKTDICVFRPSDGGWYRLNSSNNTFSPAQFGTNGDLPVPGDFDGDGKA